MATNGIDSGVETGNESNDVEIGMMNSPSESDSSYDNKIPPPPPTSPETNEGGPAFSGSFFDPPNEGQMENKEQDFYSTEEMDRDLDDFVPDSNSTFHKEEILHFHNLNDEEKTESNSDSSYNNYPVMSMESIPTPMSTSFCPPPAPPATPTMINPCKALIKFEFPELPKLVCQFVEPPAGFRNFVSVEQFQGENSKGYSIRETSESKALLPYEQHDLTRKLKNFTRSVRVKVYDDWANSHKEHCERRLRNAANSGNLELLNRLLQRGVNANAGDEHGRTPLHLASCKGYTEIVKSLLQSGADPYQKDILGNTPLHLASCTNHIQVVTCLLRAGTDVMALDNNGRNPLQLAQSKLKLLASSSGKYESGDSGKIKREVHQIIEMMQEYLQKKGQDVEAELLNSFASRLTLSQTPEEVDADVKNLLANLSSLSISPTQEASGANADLSTTALNKELHDLKSGIPNIFASKSANRK